MRAAEAAKPGQPTATMVSSAPQAAQPAQADQVAAQQLQDQPATTIDLSALNQKNWPELFTTLQLKGGSRELARHLAVLENQENVITFAVDHAAEIFMNEKAQNAIRSRLLAGRDDYKVKFTVQQQVQSVAQLSKQAAAKETAALEQVDSVVEHLQQQFGAEIIQNKLGD